LVFLVFEKYLLNNKLKREKFFQKYNKLDNLKNIVEIFLPALLHSLKLILNEETLIFVVLKLSLKNQFPPKKKKEKKRKQQKISKKVTREAR
jgi:Na+-driven multidrug efflux pump